MTGQYPHTHGIVVNDQHIKSNAIPLAEVLRDGGYSTAYIGKWHIDGHGRSTCVPPERRLGFEFWRGFECTHDYNDSYYDDTEGVRHRWQGYDAFAQTREAQEYIRERTGGQPFALFLSWGPPHDPYDTAPAEYRSLFSADRIELRPNVPDEAGQEARRILCGYYAHGTALDAAFGKLLNTLDETGLAENTIVIFTSDHGDMLRSHGSPSAKQQPWEESIRVPFLIRMPGKRTPRTVSFPIDAPDIMPTILSLCGLSIPETVQGTDCSQLITDEKASFQDAAAYLSNYFCFHSWRPAIGGKEWRGLRTERHTYVIDHDGSWLLYDNMDDAAQQRNLIGEPDFKQVQKSLHETLLRRMEVVGDAFEPGMSYISRFDIPFDEEKNDIPIKW